MFMLRQKGVHGSTGCALIKLRSWLQWFRFFIGIGFALVISGGAAYNPPHTLAPTGVDI